MFRLKNIVILDDQPLYIHGLEHVLEGSTKYRVAASFNKALDLYCFLEKNPVDIVLLDINISSVSGFQVLQKIKLMYPDIEVVIVSSRSDEKTISRAFESGASGYFTKDSRIVEFLTMLNTVIEGEMYTSQKIDGNIKKASPCSQQDKANLTEKELEVLKKICEEKNSHTIAQELDISIHAVNSRRKSILKKTDSTNLVSLIKFAYVEGHIN